MGLETLGGVMTKLIDRNTTIPTRKSQTFTTAEDGQTSFDIHVLQGEREMATDNKTLGKFRLEGLPPAPRGVPQVEVTFDIDANGITHVNAKDLGTGREQRITITASSNLSKEDIDRMVRDASSHAEEDKRKKDEVETRNRADNLAYATEKMLKEIGDKVSESDKADVQKSLDNVRSLLKSGTADELKRATEQLEQTSMKLGQAVYAKAGQAPGGDGASAGGNGSAGPTAGSAPEAGGAQGDVIDAEFKEH
jgi:molecular chaperone DnaK